VACVYSVMQFVDIRLIIFHLCQTIHFMCLCCVTVLALFVKLMSHIVMKNTFIGVCRQQVPSAGGIRNS
jgi:hypothetical protein